MSSVSTQNANPRAIKLILGHATLAEATMKQIKAMMRKTNWIVMLK
jgi:hypothetical protein